MINNPVLPLRQLTFLCHFYIGIHIGIKISSIIILVSIIIQTSSTDTLLNFLIKASCGGCPPEDDLWRMCID